MSDKTTIINRVIPFNFVAGLISYFINSSVLWAIVHWVCGPIYVLYSIFAYPNKWRQLMHLIRDVLSG